MNVARSHGLDALTMRLVADDLGSGTMSLYRHVVDRDDMLRGMIELVGERVVHPPQKDDPVEEIADIFSTIYRAFRADPWVVRYLIDGNIGSRRIFPLVERIMLALEALKFNGGDAWRTFNMLLHYTYGEVLVIDGAQRRLAPAQKPEPEFLQNFPAIARNLVAAAGEQGSSDTFQRNIRRLLQNLSR